MESILNFFSVRTVFFNVLDYPMSYIEFIGTILYLASVWLIAQKKMLTWPVGIASVILYGILFYQIQLYSDTIEQLYYLGASVYGWIYWHKNKEPDSRSVDFRFSSPRHLLAWIGITIGFTLLLTLFMKDIHEILPRLFPVPASFPLLDALTTIMSFVAMFLMAQKRIESWIYWIIVDIIGIGLYFVKNVKFVSLLYVILLSMAVRGLIKWHYESKEKEINQRREE